MAVLTKAAFRLKWQQRFRDNDLFEIDEADMREFAEDVNDSFGQVASNLRPGGPFYVRHFYAAQKVSEDDSCLEDIPLELLCLGCPVHVEFAPEAGWWWPVWDGNGYATNAPRIAQDGRFNGWMVPYKWAKEGSQEAAEGAVEFFDANKTGGYFGPDSPPVSVVRYTMGDSTLFYSALQDMLPPCPLPTDATYWQEVAPPVPGETTHPADLLTEAQVAAVPQDASADKPLLTSADLSGLMRLLLGLPLYSSLNPNNGTTSIPANLVGQIIEVNQTGKNISEVRLPQPLLAGAADGKLIGIRNYGASNATSGAIQVTQLSRYNDGTYTNVLTLQPQETAYFYIGVQYEGYPLNANYAAWQHFFSRGARPGAGSVDLSNYATVAALETVRATLPASSTVTGSYTLQASDKGNLVPVNSTSACSIIIPDDSVAMPIGTLIEVAQENAGQVNITGASGVTITAYQSTKTAGQYASVWLRKIGANSWRVTGGIA